LVNDTVLIMFRLFAGIHNCSVTGVSLITFHDHTRMLSGRKSEDKLADRCQYD